MTNTTWSDSYVESKNTDSVKVGSRMLVTKNWGGSGGGGLGNAWSAATKL